MASRTIIRTVPQFVVLTLLFVVGAPVSWGQTASSEEEDDFTIRDENAGYIDIAIPGNQVRMIFDSGYDLNRPTRNEFFYAKRGPDGPGLPLPETSIDYQDAQVYMEALVAEDVSAFLQVGSRSLNPDINDNSTGLSDMQLGVKAAFVSSPDMVLSGQLRVSLPTGDSDRGLGTHNTNIEPGLLLFAPVDDRLALLGELRYWIPVDGTDFAGPVLRYGIGTQYTLYESASTKIVPIVELVGWTAFDGLTITPPPTSLTEDADGDTIVNLKAGARIGLGENMDLYGGYGHSLTGDRWYRDVIRFEIRFMF
jgi:hypothetical protein